MEFLLSTMGRNTTNRDLQMSQARSISIFLKRGAPREEEGMGGRAIPSENYSLLYLSWTEERAKNCLEEGGGEEKKVSGARGPRCFSGR